MHLFEEKHSVQNKTAGSKAPCSVAFFMFRSMCSLKGDLQSAFQSDLQRQENKPQKNGLKNKIQKLILFGLVSLANGIL